MKIGEFVEMVKAMRSHQKSYYKHRKPSDLNKSKEFERRVDQAVKAYTKDPDSLIARPTTPPLFE